MRLERFEEQILFSTVRITTPSADGVGASVGTGFLYGAPAGDTGKRVILLVSSRHVFGDPGQPITVNFHRKDAEGSGPSLGQIVRLHQDEFSGMYVGHPRPEVDLACLNVSVIGEPANQVFYKTISPDIVCDFSDKDLMPGGEVWFVGYPENRFDVVNNLPIVRRGYIASAPKVDFNGLPQFVIDAQVFPGSSGSPVFGRIGNRYQFLGVVTQVMIREEKLQAVPTSQAAGLHQVLGLGIVLKARLLTELVDEVMRRILPTPLQGMEPTIDGTQAEIDA